MEFVRSYGIVLLFALTTNCSIAQSAYPQLKNVCQHEAQLHVIVFLDPECPISQKYTHTLNELISAYHDKNIRFYGIISVQRVQSAEISEFVNTYGLKLTCVNDSALTVAAALRASVTPEVFLLAKDLDIIYSGAIDDWYYDLGKSSRKARTPYLRQAINAYLNDKPIQRKRTEPIGCKISYTKLETP